MLDEVVAVYFVGVRRAKSFDYGCWKPGMAQLYGDAPPTPWFTPGRDGQIAGARAAKVCWQEHERTGRNGRPEGEMRFAREDGWTLISFWDGSGDHRKPGSAFAIERDLTNEEALGLARRLFPEIFERIERRLGREVRLAPATCPMCRRLLEVTGG